MNVKDFWDKAISYNQYLTETKEIVANPKTDEQKDFLEYYKLGVQRMDRMAHVYKPNEDQVKRFAKKHFKGKILIISEGWCGDASQVLPVVVKFFEQYEIRISYRDQEPSLIGDFLTNGAKSIPVVLFLDNNYKVISHWGPRPKYGMELLAKHKANPEKYTNDDFHNDVQVYYAKNKGLDTIEEILEKI